MERDIPFFDCPRLEGRFVLASAGWGGAGGACHGGAVLVVANPDGETFTVLHRLFGPDGDARDDWDDLTEAQMRTVALSIARSQRQSPNFATAREEQGARRLLDGLDRDAYESSWAEEHRLTRAPGTGRPEARTIRGLGDRPPARGRRVPRG